MSLAPIKKITPIIKKGLENAALIKILADIRDTLLPMLISGKLQVNKVSV